VGEEHAVQAEEPRARREGMGSGRIEHGN
jgi:hypothetical protein